MGNKTNKQMAAETLVGATQSSLLLRLLQHQPKLGLQTKTWNSNRNSLSLSLRLKPVSNHKLQVNHHQLSKRIVVAGVTSDSKAPSIVNVEAAVKDIDIQADTGGGNGFGDLGGSGGGGGWGGGGDNSGSGGGDNTNEEGEGGSEEEGKKMSMSQKLTLGYAALVGVGGLMGFLKSGSQKSLLAGGVSASVLYYVYTVLPTNPVFASSIGLGISAALLTVMGSRFKKSGKVFPPGVVSLVSLIMAGGYLHGIMRSMH